MYMYIRSIYLLNNVNNYVLHSQTLYIDFLTHTYTHIRKCIPHWHCLISYVFIRVSKCCYSLTDSLNFTQTADQLLFLLHCTRI